MVDQAKGLNLINEKSPSLLTGTSFYEFHLTESITVLPAAQPLASFFH